MNNLKIKVRARTRKALLLFFTPLVHTTLQDYTFTMRKYIDFRVDGKYGALKRWRFLPVPDIVLFHAAVLVMNEYVSLSKDENLMRNKAAHDRKIATSRRYFVLRAMGVALESPNLTKAQREKLIKVLSDSGVRGSDPEKRILAELRAIKIRLEEESAGEVKTPDKPVTRSDFMNIFSYLAREGYPVSLNTPVIQYIEMLNVHRDHQKQVEQMMKKKHGNPPTR